MILAAIDVGSNTVKLLVARGEEGKMVAVREEIAPTRLGAGIGEGKPLSAEAVQRTVEAVVKFAGIAREAKAERILAVATEAARSAPNASDLLRACRSHGVDLEILSGEEEARLSWLGGTIGQPAGPSVVLDVGGGSAEITAGDGDRLTWSTRLPLGAVRLREMFLPTIPALPSAWTLLEDHVHAVLASVPSDLPGPLVGVGGTVAALARLIHQSDSLEPIPADRLASVSLFLRTLARPQILALGVPWGREDIIAAGAAVVVAVTRHLSRPALVPSRTGLRWGLLRQLLR